MTAITPGIEKSCYVVRNYARECTRSDYAQLVYDWQGCPTDFPLDLGPGNRTAMQERTGKALFLTVIDAHKCIILLKNKWKSGQPTHKWEHLIAYDFLILLTSPFCRWEPERELTKRSKLSPHHHQTSPKFYMRTVALICVDHANSCSIHLACSN